MACESGRKRRLRTLVIAPLALTAALWFAAPIVRAAQPGAAEHAAAAAPENALAGESFWPFIAKIFNFAALVGLLVYFLRGPIVEYLGGRRTQVRADLEAARALKADAERQMAELEARLKALPGEIAALEARGREEIAAEEQRIREMAAAERQRLLEQATREIDQHVRMARRELVELAADLAVGAAEHRIRHGITDADRARLVDTFVQQVGSHE